MRLAGLGFAAVMLAAGVAGALGAERGMAQMGRGLAETWCASCHLIGNEPGDKAPAASEAPSFVAVAEKFDAARREALATWLATPHGKMPSLSLSRAEIADILAYIETLGGAPGR